MKPMKRNLLVAVTLLVMSLISCDGVGKKPIESHEAAKIEFMGDVDRDAEEMARRSVELSRKMLDGNDTEADVQQMQQWIDAAKEYYAERGRRDEFMIAVNEKMAKVVSDLSQKMKEDSAQLEH